MVVFPAPDNPAGEKNSKHAVPLEPAQGQQPVRFTGEPDGAASEASSRAYDLPSLASTNMVGLVHHIGWSLEILK